MVVKTIRLVGDPVLRQECPDIKDYHSVTQIVEDLQDTLLDFRTKNGFGSGIAAPQIGETVRAIYISTKEFEGEILNPQITKHSDVTALFWDACFSFEPSFFAKVKRWTSVEVEYYDILGNKKIIKNTTEHLAALLQHEIDHINKVLFIDRIVQQGDYIIPCSVWKHMGKPLRVD
ncbi:MAG: peptide deformylase [Candidatus Micrarchaeota archaeon]